MNHECKENISEEFILKHISEDNNLIEKYEKFKKRIEILQDKNKKLCPNPDCDSFLQKSKKTKYVKCEYGHEYCFDCLRPPHGNESCDNNLEKQLVDWTKGKRVKRCPRCKIYTEKNEGCNHMTCINCKYQWCWLCEGEYKYGHYDSGRCKDQWFAIADYPKEINNDNNNLNNDRDNRNDVTCCFGLHRIFRSLYPNGYINVSCFGDDKDNLVKKYIFILLFWFFGIFIIFFAIYFDNAFMKIIL